MEVGDVIEGDVKTYTIIEEFDNIRDGVRRYKAESDGVYFFLKRYLEERWEKDSINETRAFQSLKDVNHKHILLPHEIRYETHEFIFPFIEGSDIGALYNDKFQLKMGSVLSVITNIGNALSLLHSLGRLHLDIKIDNIMIGFEEDNRPENEDFEFNAASLYLIDFGCSQNIGYLAGDIIIGSPISISPEILQGKEVDQRADIYGLASATYELITGEIIYNSPVLEDMLKEVVFGKVPRIDYLAHEISKDMSDLIHKSLSKNPNERPETVDEFVRCFNQAI